MERSIRIGKDFNVRWSINKVVDGERQPYVLAGKELVLQYRTPYGLKEATEWKVVGNTIVWTFRGKEQKALGSYELILTENGGKDGMVTVDTCRAFKLVAHSCEETEGSGSDIVTDVVMLESEVAFAPIVAQGGGSYDDTAIWEALASQEQLIEDLQNMKIDREADDYYPKLTVGLADNLAGVDVVDSEINFRRSGGGAITDGVARIESVKGNSVVWNQRWDINGDNHVDNVADKTIVGAETIITLNSGGQFCRIRTAYAHGEEGHVYAISYAAKYNRKNNESVLTAYVGFSLSYANQMTLTDLYQNYSEIWKGDYNGQINIGVIGTRNDGDVVSFKDIKIIDLTRMFGAGNEPTTIEEFYQRIPMGVDLNAYNEGEVIHMDVQSIESVGVNAWDEEWEVGEISGTTGIDLSGTDNKIRTGFIRVIPNLQYYISIQGKINKLFVRARLYDADKEFIGITSASGSDIYANEAFTIPANAHYIRFAPQLSVVSQSDLFCINLSDASVNGQYFPYIKRVENLSIIRKYFRDGMKSAGSAHDEIRYNKASGKWEKVEAVGVRTYQEGDADNAAYLTDGKVTCYPLAEPIITELDEADQFKDLDYAVWNCGTEKAIAEGKSAPLAADITYGFNAICKIKELDSLVAALRAKVGI